VISSILKRQTGAAAVTTALLMTILLGFAALVIDVGYMAVTKSQLQTAADAAALAGCARLGNANPNKANAESTATTYARNRPGEATDTVTPVANVTNRTLQVTISRNAASFFASALGMGSNTITATATAQVVAAAAVPPGAPPFVIQAPSTPIVWQGGPNGDSYSQQYIMQKTPSGEATFTYVNTVFKRPTNNETYQNLLKYGSSEQTTLNTQLYYIAPATASKTAVESFADRLTQPGNQNILEAKAGDPRLMLIPVVEDLLRVGDGGYWSYSTKGLKIIGFIGFWLDSLDKGELSKDSNYYPDYRAYGRFVRVPLPAGAAPVAGNQFFGTGQIQLIQ